MAETNSLFDALFQKCVVIRAGQRCEIKCRLGLWSVDASTQAEAEREAKHYWLQYFRDGEYDHHLLKTAK